MNDLVRENIRKLVPYSCARDEFKGEAQVYLDANENWKDYSSKGFNRYPDPFCTDLRKKIEKIMALPFCSTVIGNGSDELIDNLIRIYCEPKEDSILLFPPTYGAYKVFADINNVKVDEVALKSNFDLDLKKIDEYFDKRLKEKGKCKLVFICSPNNPTGNAQSIESIKYILEKKNSMVIVDEAYGEFSQKESATSLIPFYDNLIVLKTLSKCWALAGARIGILVAGKDCCNLMNKIKAPYNVGIPSQKAALEILDNYSLIFDEKEAIIKRRDYYKELFSKLKIVKDIYDSDANFLLIKTLNSSKICKDLSQKGIIIRNRTKDLFCSDCIRITIGSKEECLRVYEALKEVKI